MAVIKPDTIPLHGGTNVLTYTNTVAAANNNNNNK